MISINEQHPIMTTTSKQTINSTETTRTQTLKFRYIFVDCCLTSMKLNSVAKDEKLLMLIEYRVS